MSQQPATRIDLVPGSVLPSVGNELRDLAGHPPAPTLRAPGGRRHRPSPVHDAQSSGWPHPKLGSQS